MAAEPTNAAVPAIEAIELRRSYGTVSAVNDISFSVRQGEFFAVLGPNGAGKSTLMHMLTTVTEPSGGTAKVLGFNVATQQGEVRKLLGMVFQDTALDERMTAGENLHIHAVLYGIARQERAEAVNRALAWAELEDVDKRLVRTFSGGMKRRLELARALMHRPRVLFLDEPTIGLDPQGRRHLWDRIASIRDEGVTVLMTTHNLNEANACDRVAIVDNGKLVALDTPAALIEAHTPGVGATLEDAFLALTGRSLRDQGASGRDQLLSFSKRGGELTR
ncbi:ABC transporter ATP-binding protein [Devosia rhizoryzae]|uniref:ATP-binding cassette domain-containing protein n=1 Tax=Devosia rhizoryzae TaxID=2774137 RepID=A0ABX7C6V9_9HYPH|nr:ATP-binding cassette domain-containing protein [Devosia rhizoryzae]QQR40010.1 ATP-binding cassette domain-containing protein [Devosia rhizoryzae]